MSERIDELVESLHRRLSAEGTARRARAEKAYLKSELVHLGTPVPAVRKIVRAVAPAKTLTRVEVLALAQALWGSDTYEHRLAAVELLWAASGKLEARDLAVVERLARGCATWALLDPLAVNVAGDLIERFPDQVSVLDRWAIDERFWLRRAAMLALLKGLRTGGGDFERFTRYADAMLEEQEFFIRKAIGWVLREAGRKDPRRVATWIIPRASRCSSVTLREAVKPLSPADRARVEAARALPARVR